MAQRILESLVDDIDETPAGGTVRFALDGQEYEIDLSPEHEAELRESLAPWIGKARKKRTVRSRRGRKTREDLPTIREWAVARGHDVKERGRVPEHIIAEYDALKEGHSAAR